MRNFQSVVISFSLMLDKSKFQLSFHEGLTRLSTCQTDGAFINLYAGEKWFKIKKSILIFISPFFETKFREDANMSYYTLPFNDPNVFQLAIDLFNGKIIEANESEKYFLFQVGKFLLNTEMCNLFSDEKDDELNIYKSIQRIKYRPELGLSIDKEIEMIAKNLWMLSEDEIMEIPSSMYHLIFGSPALSVNSEKWLMDIIISIIGLKGNSLAYLLGFVEISYLDYISINRFVEKVGNEDITGILWETISKRLVLPVETETSSSPRVLARAGEKEFRMKESEPWKGIFDALTSEGGGNPYLKGLIKFRTSQKDRNPKDHFMFSSKSGKGCFIWDFNNPSWVNIDFDKYQVFITQYSIMNQNKKNPEKYMSKWKILASNNGENWFIIDERSDQHGLKTPGKIISYTIKQPGFYKYIKIITEAGEPLIITNIEFYGKYRSIS